MEHERNPICPGCGKLARAGRSHCRRCWHEIEEVARRLPTKEATRFGAETRPIGRTHLRTARGQ